ncbi:GNAT family N-acetyltransferase [Dyadobacter subterraneus]|uniref:GNAT family N-acetyltransferase n=1 Tax=Dyadobacter subterraneus TaxID=2773304 RepID=A0ABR9WGP6_9BACT|nr:N-acetyltransferase [Dyadobacter subterraneus]MBE9464669.1 GNAT family N-acetyltransferase [Dyadobacter subterraneus]
MNIRKAIDQDRHEVWEIFTAVIQTGDTYVFAPDTAKEDLDKHWFSPYMDTYVLEENGEILGTYIIKPNQIDLGSHIANASYMVHPKAQGRGIGNLLCEHSLMEARKFGFMAMQFNLVVSTNKVAVKLWQKFGFTIIGTIPDGFNHLTLGYVDAFIMYLKL